MTFVRLAFFPGGTRDHYDALDVAMRGVPAPEDRLLFATGPVDGGWQVVQVWTSRDRMAEFNTAWFLPALAAVGERGFPAPPQVTDFEPVGLSLQPEAGSVGTTPPAPGGWTPS